ncbi:MAG: hypothetical protein AVDCRST_MAG35-1471, partial [uncultured Quadrisphaera sp.]
ASGTPADDPAAARRSGEGEHRRAQRPVRRLGDDRPPRPGAARGRRAAPPHPRRRRPRPERQLRAAPRPALAAARQRQAGHRGDGRQGGPGRPDPRARRGQHRDRHRRGPRRAHPDRLRPEPEGRRRPGLLPGDHGDGPGRPDPPRRAVPGRPRRGAHAGRPPLRHLPDDRVRGRGRRGRHRVERVRRGRQARCPGQLRALHPGLRLLQVRPHGLRPGRRAGPGGPDRHRRRPGRRPAPGGRRRRLPAPPRV